MIFMAPRWKKEEDDALMYEAMRVWEDRVRQVTRERGTDDPFMYINFSGPHQKPLCGYGEQNLRFLRAVARKYDPERVFQELVPGGFKLDDAC